MNNSIFSRIFGNSNQSKAAAKASKKRRGRQCRIEELESREMLCTWNPVGGAVFDGAWDLDAGDTEDNCIIAKTLGVESGALKAEKLDDFNDAQVNALFELGFSNHPDDAGSDFTWGGKVEWDSTENVIKIDCTGLELDGNPDFSEFTSLKELNLSGQTDIEYLNVSGTQIDKLDIEDCTKLRTLLAAGCDKLETITWPDWADAGVQPTLEVLDISGCIALTDYPADLNKLVNLTDLNVADLELDALNLSALTKLEKLEIGGNHLNFTGNTLLLHSSRIVGQNLTITGTQFVTGVVWASENWKINLATHNATGYEVWLRGIPGGSDIKLEEGVHYTVNAAGVISFIEGSVFHEYQLKQKDEIYVKMTSIHNPGVVLETNNLEVKFDAPSIEIGHDIAKKEIFWSGVSPETGIEGYAVQRWVAGAGTTQGSWVTIATVPKVTSGSADYTYTYSDLPTGTFLRVVVWKSGTAANPNLDFTQYSTNIKTGVTPTSAVAAPTNVSVAQTKANSVKVSWVQSWNAEGYKVQVSTDGVNWSDVPMPAGTAVKATSWEITTGLSAEVLYRFRVIATGSDGTESTPSASSAEIAVKDQAGINAMTALNGNFRAKAAKAYSPSEVTINLKTQTGSKAITGDVLYYEIICTSHPALGTFVVAGNVNTFKIAGLKAGTTYKFAVKVYGKDGNQYKKDVKVSAKTQKGAAAPKSIKRAGGLESVTLFNLEKNATYMVDVWQTSGSGKGYYKTVEVTADANGYAVVDGLQPNGTKYRFQVSKAGASGELSAARNISGATLKLNKSGQFPAVKSVKVEANSTAIKMTFAPSLVGEVENLVLGATYTNAVGAPYYFHFENGYLNLEGYRIGLWSSKTSLVVLPEAYRNITSITIGETLDSRGRVTVTITGVFPAGRQDFGIQAWVPAEHMPGSTPVYSDIARARVNVR